jgi:hypothetical protein
MRKDTGLSAPLKDTLVTQLKLLLLPHNFQLEWLFLLSF